jgi:hypothetical protein
MLSFMVTMALPSVSTSDATGTSMASLGRHRDLDGQVTLGDLLGRFRLGSQGITHLTQGIGQLPDFVPLRDIHLLAEVASGNGRGDRGC